MTKRRKKKNESKVLKLILIILIFIYVLYFSDIDSTYSMDNASIVNSNLIVSYLDVGQADSILIENNNEYMLIDAGNNDDGELLVKYFKEKGINEFKYVVGTHPHEDHIGGMDDIINSFEVGDIYIPDAITTTKTFLDMLEAIDKKDKTYKVPKINDTFMLGEALITVLYTGDDLSDLNNTSIVLRLDFGSTSYLFTGDATDKTENILLENNANIDVDILKVGHHGSKYSTTNKFLNEVSPNYAIISVGEGNSYKHPEDIILKRLNDNNIKVHRTDLEGTIIISSNGKDIKINNIDTNLDG